MARFSAINKASHICRCGRSGESRFDVSSNIKNNKRPNKSLHPTANRFRLDGVAEI